jgi:hypothetical protein
LLRIAVTTQFNNNFSAGLESFTLLGANVNLAQGKTTGTGAVTSEFVRVVTSVEDSGTAGADEDTTVVAETFSVGIEVATSTTTADVDVDVDVGAVVVTVAAALSLGTTSTCVCCLERLTAKATSADLA